MTNNYRKKYRKIIGRLVDRSFANLKNKNFKIFEFGIIRLYGAYLPGNFIGINKKCRNFSEDEIKGLLVHELCHAETVNKKNFINVFFIFVSYWTSPKLREKIEIETDKLVIEKGYGKQLFKLVKKIEFDLGREDRYGLTSKEINLTKK